MKLSNVKIGEKFYHLNRENKSFIMYLRIDMNPSVVFKSAQLPYNTVCASDLSTYKIMCINGDYEVEFEHNNVYI